MQINFRKTGINKNAKINTNVMIGDSAAQVEGLIMVITLEKVMDEALSLPTDVRIGLVKKILKSLNLPTCPEIGQLWAKEAERRVEEMDKTTVELLSGEKVFTRIRNPHHCRTEYLYASKLLEKKI